MESFELENGLSVVCDSRPTESVAVELSVRVGSNNERREIAGISHFLEHMMFEGTVRRPDSASIANEIEGVGGVLNAGTSNERTVYYIKVPKKYFLLSLDVLSDLFLNSRFNKQGIDNNRKVIIDEINLVNDEPLFYQWILFYRELFKGTRLKEPIYGTLETVAAMARDDLTDYFTLNYVPENMVLGLSGGFNADVNTLEKHFGSILGIGLDNSIEIEVANKRKVVREKKALNHSYLVYGYRTVPRTHEDAPVLDVIHAVLGRGQSGWMFDEIRNKRALAYNVGVEHKAELDYGLFAVNVGTNARNVEEVTGLIGDTFARLDGLTKKQLEEAKRYVEGNRLLELEENLNRAELMCFYAQAGRPELLGTYFSLVDAVTLDDVKAVADRYLTDKYTLTVLEQEI